METPASPSSLQPLEKAPASVYSNPTVQDHPSSSKRIINKKKKKRVFKNVSAMQTSSSSSSSSSTCYASRKGVHVGFKRRNPKVVFGAVRGGNGGGDVEAIALPLGMSFAVVVAQVLERKDSASERMSVDHLAMICTSAVRESLANVFGDKYDCFASNFEKSFGSTLGTLRLINESSMDKGGYHLSNLNIECSMSDVTFKNKGGCTSNSCINNCYSEVDWNNNATQNQLSTPEDVQEDSMNQENTLYGQTDVTIENSKSDTSKHKGHCISNSGINDCHSETDWPAIAILSQSNTPAEEQERMSKDRELALHGQTNQLVCVSSSTLGSVTNQSMLNTIEKSVVEQVRSNDLKALELGLTMRRLKLKETQVALNYDSNNLERSKLAMGISKASFKAEKFKNQLEDMRHVELLKKCIDCLVAGLLIMSVSLSYGAYVFSYTRITEATAACAPLSQESKSWWMPKPMASFNSGLNLLKCQVQVLSRMLFGVLMILAIAYLLLQRSATSKQTMPVTFLLLLLGIACGFAGKLCVDTLGGSGYHWLLYWEVLCLLHFFSNACTSALFFILYGPVAVSQGMKSNTMIPYWMRRLLFYATVLIFLPLLCGFMPFASPVEWKDHFFLLVTDFLSVTDD